MGEEVLQEGFGLLALGDDFGLEFCFLVVLSKHLGTDALSRTILFIYSLILLLQQPLLELSLFFRRQLLLLMTILSLHLTLTSIRRCLPRCP